MNTKRILIFVFLVIQALMSHNIWAATYYVDNGASNSSDSNAGTQQLPWKLCPGMAGWAGNTRLAAGDTVYFNSTGTWTQSGSSSLLTVVGGVTYDGRSWGGGKRAIFRMLGNNSSANRPGVIIFLQDDPSTKTVVNGFEIDGNNKYISGITVAWPTKASLSGATKVIENCVVHDLGDPGGTGFGIYGIKLGALSNYITQNVEIINDVVYNAPRAGISIYDAVSTTGTHEIKNVLIRGCEVYNAGNGSGTNGNGIQLKDKVTNITAEYNYLHGNDGRGIFLENASGRPGPQNAVLRYNVITANNTGGITIAQPASKSADIYGNLIFRNKDAGSGGSGIYFETNLSENLNVRIYNNTLFENANGEILVSSAASFTTFEIKNNILYSLSSKVPLVNNASGQITSHSNNIYYRPGGGTLVTDRSSYQSSSLSSWESASLTSDPLLKNISKLPTGFTGTYGIDFMPNADGLSITTDSPAVDSGVSLSTTYNGSINSVVRPVGAKWDIGAYEYAAGGVTPPPTTTTTTTTTPTTTEVIPSSVLLVKADSGTLTAPMQVVSSADTPGGSYIITTTSNSGSAVYNVNINQAGKYKIVAEVYAPDASSDSFLVKVDSGTEDIWDLNPTGDATQYNVWRQDEVTARGAGTFDAPQFDPLILNFAVGGHTVTFNGRDSNTRLAYFYFEMIPAKTEIIEAESGVLTTPMQVISSSVASGGAYIATTTSNSGSAVYTFNIVQPGTYKIVAEIYAPDANSDSFFIKVDSGTEDIWDLNPTGDATLYNVWRQEDVTARGAGTFNAPQLDPLVLNLTAGTHTITFNGRDSNSRLDSFYLEQISTIPSIIKIKIE